MVKSEPATAVANVIPAEIVLAVEFFPVIPIDKGSFAPAELPEACIFAFVDAVAVTPVLSNSMLTASATALAVVFACTH